MDGSIHRLNVSLRHIRPAIWRRLEVPAELSLWQVHRVVQAAMGWGDYHLHEFRCRGIHYGQSDHEFGFYRENERRVLLHEVLRAPKDRMIYQYDFGDSWAHDILLERVTVAEPGDAILASSRVRSRRKARDQTRHGLSEVTTGGSDIDTPQRVCDDSGGARVIVRHLDDDGHR